VPGFAPFFEHPGIDTLPVVADSDLKSRVAVGDLGFDILGPRVLKRIGKRLAANQESLFAHDGVQIPSGSADADTELRRMQLGELLPFGRDGLLQRLVRDRAELPLIFMSSHIDVPATVQAMKGGALEFLAKPLSREALVEAISQAIERSHAALSQLAQVGALQQRFESLSRREKDVMGLVITGRLNKLVAADLGISVITVKAHRGKMMRKMKAGSLLELASMVGKLRLGVGAMATNA
jgi:FixJ family two-component response regulator